LRAKQHCQQYIQWLNSSMSNDTLRMDVAGSLFTSMHRNVKIKGEAPAAQNLDGTGSVSKAARHVELLSSRFNCSTSVCVSVIAVKLMPALLDSWYGVLNTAGLRALSSNGTSSTSSTTACRADSPQPCNMDGHTHSMRSKMKQSVAIHLTCACSALTLQPNPRRVLVHMSHCTLTARAYHAGPRL